MRRVALPLACAALAGCAVGPNYRTPDTPTPPAFAEAPQPAPPGQAPAQNAPAQPTVDLARWWTAYQDPELDRLIAIALTESLDVKTVQSRVREARLQVRAARAELFPEVDATGSVDTVHFSKNAGLSNLASLFGGGGGGSTGGSGGASGGGSGGSGGSSQGIAAPGSGITTYALGFDASWELDVFGGTRRQIESARAQAAAAEWDVRDAAVSLVAEVADTYLQLRLLQERERVARAQVAAQARMIDLMAHTAQAGLTPEGDFIRQRAQLAQTQATLPPIVSDEKVQAHALGVLLGRAPEGLLAEIETPRALPAAPPQVPAGLPSDLLRRRPDVRAAERRLAGATAQVGVAVAELYPKFNLTGMAELISTSLGNLFTSDSAQLMGNASAMFPVLDFGRRRAQVGISKEEAEQAYIAYQRTVLTALRDVEDALARISAERSRNAALRKGVADSQRSLAAVQARYQTGLVDLSAVLQAQSTLLTTQDSLASSDGTLTRDLAAFYKALGGGWSEGDVAGTKPDAKEYTKAKRGR